MCEISSKWTKWEGGTAAGRDAAFFVCPAAPFCPVTRPSGAAFPGKERELATMRKQNRGNLDRCTKKNKKMPFVFDTYTKV